MKKIHWAQLLAMLLCFALLAACGGSAAPAASSAEAPAEDVVPDEDISEDVDEDPTEEETASAVEEEVLPEWEYTPISYPLTKDEVSLSYWLIWELSNDTMYNDINEHVVIDMLAKATGVRLDIKAQPQATGQTNTDLMIASGDYPYLIGNLSYATGMDAASEDES